MQNSPQHTYEIFRNFMNGFTAATQLLQRAGENGFLIESICLSATIIDGLLRIGIILQHQLSTKTNQVLDFLLCQSKEDRIISERQIYRMAFNKNIITESIYLKLEELYKKRNRVIHRYIISDISTKEVLNIGIEYEGIRHLVSDAIERLEDEQIASGIGMTKGEAVNSDSEIIKEMDEMSKTKHASPILDYAFKKKKVRGS